MAKESKRKIVLNSDGISRAVARIAHEILERNRGGEEIVILGIPTRGYHLALRLGESIKRIEDHDIPTGAVDATLYRDDIAITGTKPLKEMDIPVAIDGKTVILVDDVIFTGRTIRAAMNALMDFGRPNIIQLAVLVDRGHRELPIKPDYVGKNLPTSLTEDVKVHLEESDKINEVVLSPKAKE